ncbi:hypothetical protein DW839_11490 [Enterocloster bolteae]|uniref:Uncharacterized protein n=1 Tax=Enterocloster bolteae TaxID=208479 RepID=A0A414AWJ2_9FIRM|nr:hypothetical protein DW839_11490 [Enterocloster bolteae]
MLVRYSSYFITFREEKHHLKNRICAGLYRNPFLFKPGRLSPHADCRPHKEKQAFYRLLSKI